jgi:hypothetical protein
VRGQIPRDVKYRNLTHLLQTQKRSSSRLRLLVPMNKPHKKRVHANNFFNFFSMKRMGRIASLQRKEKLLRLPWQVSTWARRS